MLNYPVSFQLNVVLAVLFICKLNILMDFMILLEIGGNAVDGIIFLTSNGCHILFGTHQ